MWSIFRFAFPVSRGSWPNIFLLAFGSFIIFLLGLVSPFATQAIVDRVLVSGNVSTLQVIVGILVFVAIFEALLGGFRGFIGTLTGLNMGRNAVAHAYGTLVHLRNDFFSRFSAGEIIARTQELSSISNAMTNRSFEIVFEVLYGVIFFAILFWINATMTMVIVAAALLQGIVSICFGPFLRHFSRRVFDRNAKVSNAMMTAVGSPLQVKGQQMEFALVNHLGKRNNHAQQASLKLSVLGVFYGQGSDLIWGIINPIITFIGFASVMKGELTLGQLLAFQMFSGRVTGTLEMLAGLFDEFQAMRVSAQRLGDIAEYKHETNEVFDYNPPAATSLTLKNWEVAPPISLPADENLSDPDVIRQRRETILIDADMEAPRLLSIGQFELPRDNAVAVVGPSGAGKTVFVQSLLRLVPVVAGTMTLGLLDVTHDPVEHTRANFSYATSNDELMGDTFLEAIAMANPNFQQDMVEPTLAALGMDQILRQKFGGYDFPIEHVRRILSQGQYQRLTLARAVLRGAPILILDEATNALDQETERQFIRFVQSQPQSSLLFVTHRGHLLEEMDAVLWLANGQKVAQDHHAALLENPEYRALWQA